MARIILLILGLLAACIQQIFLPMSPVVQTWIFFAGIIFLGLPHGAADVMVAGRNAIRERKRFLLSRFLVTYGTILFAFASVLWFFPLVGGGLFIIFAAYHFGETDLYQFKTDNIAGKLFVSAYGLLILSVILCMHIEEVQPLLVHFDIGLKNLRAINWISLHRFQLMSASGVLFFATAFFYLTTNKRSYIQSDARFLIHLACLLFILFNLPLLMGFTFYFVAWHSFLSLKNIVTYLRENQQLSGRAIARQIIMYSVFAMLGIAAFLWIRNEFGGSSAVMSYLFVGLAVLTAPHMITMHNMYKHVRNKATQQHALNSGKGLAVNPLG